MKTFPKEIYVTREGEGEDEYFNVTESTDAVEVEGDRKAVARYQLVEAGEIVVSREFQKKRTGRK